MKHGDSGFPIDPLADVAISAERLSKQYGGFHALADLTLAIPRGEVFGLLGPNGAGKTTFIRTMMGFIRPTSGRVRVMGIDPVVDPVAVKRLVSYLPGDARLPREMRGRSVLSFFSQMQATGSLDRSLHIAERLELDLRRYVAFMSTGMRQKLALAAVLGASTPILVLDEPTANLDPTVRGEVLRLVNEAKDEGRTVIFSSHVLSEIEEVCSSVAFLRRGRLALEQSMRELKQHHRITANLGERHGDGLRVPQELAERVLSIDQRDERITMECTGDLARLLPWLSNCGLTQVRIEAMRLDAVYEAVHRGENVNPRSDSRGGKPALDQPSGAMMSPAKDHERTQVAAK